MLRQRRERSVAIVAESDVREDERRAPVDHEGLRVRRLNRVDRGVVLVRKDRDVFVLLDVVGEYQVLAGKGRAIVPGHAGSDLPGHLHAAIWGERPGSLI